MTYTYNSDGIRTQKTVTAAGSVETVTTDYTLEGDKVVYETNGTDAFWYYYDENGAPVSFEYNSTTYYYVKNLQGDIIAILNASGEQVVEYKYDAWGNVSIDEAPLETIGIKNPYRYRGYRYDNETGLYYLQSRYYDPKIGRFINADSYVDTGDTVLSTNMFAYCENDPVNKVDKDGTFGTPIQWACAIIGAIIGIPFGKWLANKLGYYSGVKYIAIRAGAIVGGAVLGWFAGSLMINLVKNYLASNPQTYIKIVSKFGIKALIRFKSIFGLGCKAISASTIAKIIVSADRVGSGLRKDTYHRAASWLTESQLSKGKVFFINNGRRILLQVNGKLNGKKGIFEYIIDEVGNVCHQRFKAGGVINGIPN